MENMTNEQSDKSFDDMSCLAKKILELINTEVKNGNLDQKISIIAALLLCAEVHNRLHVSDMNTVETLEMLSPMFDEMINHIPHLN